MQGEEVTQTKALQASEGQNLDTVFSLLFHSLPPHFPSPTPNLYGITTEVGFWAG